MLLVCYKISYLYMYLGYKSCGATYVRYCTIPSIHTDVSTGKSTKLSTPNTNVE